MESIFESKHTDNELEEMLDNFPGVSQTADVFKNIKIVRIEAEVFDDNQYIILLDGVTAEDIVLDMSNGTFYYAKIYLGKFIDGGSETIRCLVPIVLIKDDMRGGATLGIDLTFNQGIISWDKLDGWLYES